MTDGPPRQLIEELVSRWEHAGLRLIVVEGAYDQKFFSLVQRESHCDKAMRDVDIWEIDAVDVPDDLVGTHGLNDTGAKQRVIALGREIEALKQSAAVRGIIDMDLDRLFQLDFHSLSVVYTDHGCIEGYVWTVDSLKRLLSLFDCGGGLAFSNSRTKKLYQSIGLCCRDLAAFRVAAKLNPEWDLGIHRSDKTLSVENGETKLDLEKYVHFSRPAKGALAAAKQKVLQIRGELEPSDPLAVLNGHDLLWILTFTLKELSSDPRRLVDSVIVERALLEFGVMDSQVSNQPMIKALANWVNT
jgi:hypothetical protein